MKNMWTGSDVLFATRFCGGKKFPTSKRKYLYYLGMMIYAKISDLFVECHYVVSEHLKDELKPLRLKKEIKLLVDPPIVFDDIKKVKHDGFNILYYRGLGGNQKFKDWVYGYDIYKRMRYVFPEVTFVEVNGDDDLSKIYPLVDFYLRPNRHDGNPRMIMECEQLGIPYYWSKENPDVSEILKVINSKL
jgi:hypothetical protein